MIMPAFTREVHGRDRAYWLNPSTRRFLDQESSRDDIGFRCAMIQGRKSIRSLRNYLAKYKRLIMMT